MKVFLNVLLILLKLIVLPVIILLLFIKFIVEMLLSLAKGLVITVTIIAIAAFIILSYFGFEWSNGFQYLYYVAGAVVIIFVAYLFPTIIKGIVKGLLKFMTYWYKEPKNSKKEKSE